MDKELLDELYKREPARFGNRRLYPTEEQKKHLLALWPRGHKEDVARALGVGEAVARRWYKELTSEKAR